MHDNIVPTSAFHTTYCLNIHPGESWDENLAGIREHALRVRDRVLKDAGRRFGLGLRLSRQAAVELEAPERLREFQAFLAAENLYVFTVNAFPYGPFHGVSVKEAVYLPDWSMPERGDYTLGVARVLAALLPEGVTGSVSTVPVGYRANFTGNAESLQRACDQLAGVAQALHDLERASGRRVILALEPEPDCVCDDRESLLSLFRDELAGRLSAATRPYLGVCLDLCHAAVLFDDPCEMITAVAASGIPVAKIQVSAAPKCRVTRESLVALRDFVDSVYLHQTAVRDGAGRVQRFPDLPQALEFCEVRKLAERGDCELRTHFHVPLFCESFVGGIRSTADGIDAALFAGASAAGVEQLEIETYSFGVLKPAYRSADVVDSVVREWEWLRRRVPCAG